MRVHCCRLAYVKDGKRVTWWAMSDGKTTVAGKRGENRSDVLKRWEEKAGGKATLLVRITGVCRPSEAAATFASLAREAGG